MPYDLDKNTCDDCGITKEEAKKHPVDTGVNHPDHRYSTSFRLGWNGDVRCEKCHREHELKTLFELMDKRAASARSKE